MTDWDYAHDLVIVGSGSGGFVGALAAKANGLEPLLIEKREVVGGSSAMSGGVLWLPNNPLMAREGVPDSYEDGMAYFQALAGDGGPASSEARRHAYVTLGPQMILFLEGLGVRFRRCDNYTDYYAELPGGSARSRAIEAEVWDGNQLGPWLAKLQSGLSEEHTGGGLALAGEFSRASLGFRTVESTRTTLRVVRRTAAGRVRRQHLLANGATYIGQMLKIALDCTIPIWTESPLVDLIEENGRILGVVIKKAGREVRVRGNHGVLINAGGFAHNEEMRQQFGQPNHSKWSFSNPGDTGEAIQIAMKHGAAVDLMDEAWWTPAMVLPPNGKLTFAAIERARPCSLMVDSSAQRFCNEAANYMEVGQAMNRREREGYKANPSWLLFDQKHRNRYALGSALPRMTPKSWIESGFLKRAQGIEELAQQIEVDPATLRHTVEHFNQLAEKGEDLDFHRGESAFDKYWGDPRAPHPSLGPLDKAPYYGVQIFNGDVGTSGGILTDEHGQVLNEAGNVIPGFYASGNSTASVHGRFYSGAGASVAASGVFSYAAALHAASEAKKGSPAG
jgi:3-oxosteroid 1-dehydrogenase